MKRNKNLLLMFLIPVLCFIILQGVMPILLLFFGGITTGIEQNIISADNHKVENRCLVLEDDLVDQKSTVNKEVTRLNQILDGFLKKRNMTVQDFLEYDDMQQEYLELAFPDMMDNIQFGISSGFFLILTDHQPIEEPNDYHGLLIRASDLQNKENAVSSDYVSLNNTWSADFCFEGKDVRSADDFFYQPYSIAMKNINVDVKKLGYWSKSFVLEDDPADDGSGITYSVPLVYGGAVYGVMGIEISTSCLSSYMPVGDLNGDLNGSYALVIRTDENKYEKVQGYGTLCDSVLEPGGSGIMTPAFGEQLYKVKDAEAGEQDIYAVIKPLELYDDIVPYEDTSWALCGFVTEESIYGTEKSMFLKMLSVSAGSLVMAVMLVYIIAHSVARPFYSLIESVRNGVEGIHNFKPTGIKEINELHDVVEKLRTHKSWRSRSCCRKKNDTVWRLKVRRMLFLHTIARSRCWKLSTAMVMMAAGIVRNIRNI